MTGVGRAALVTAGAAATTFAVDRALKGVVERSLPEGGAARGPLGTRVVRRSNESGLGGATVLAGAALAVGIAGAAAAAARPPLLQVGAGLVAGGMAANLTDRADGDGVTDFLPTPLGVLNAADVAIGAGILLGGIGLVLR